MKPSSVILAMAAIAIAVMLVVPAVLRPRTESADNACLNNLRMIKHLKDQWAAKYHKVPRDVPTEADLFDLKNPMLVCPAGGTYVIGAVNQLPTCSIGPPAHILPPAAAK